MSTKEETFWKTGQLLGSVLFGGIVTNVISAIAWDTAKHVTLTQITTLAERFGAGGRDNNHNLLRALRRAECRAVVLLCEQTLHAEFQVNMEKRPLVQRIHQWWRARREPDLNAVFRIHSILRKTYRALGSASVEELVRMHGGALSDVPALIQAGRECFAVAHPDQLRDLVVKRQIEALDRAVRGVPERAGLSTFDIRPVAPNGLPPSLKQHLLRHPDGWWDRLRFTFREELKDPANQRARVAWEMDVQSELSRQLGATFEELDKKLSAIEEQLTGIATTTQATRQELGELYAPTAKEFADLRERVPSRPYRSPLQFPNRALAGTLFGRGALLATLVERLRRRDNVDIWGLAGMGKTALAAEAIHSITGDDPERLADTPYPDGIVLVDLYRLKFTSPDPAWYHLADSFDPTQPTAMPARERAVAACRGRRALVVVEGAEEAGDGETLRALFSVLTSETVQLVLTRDKHQVGPKALNVADELPRAEALALLHALCGDITDEPVRARVHELLGGHPLALTWAGSQIAVAEESRGAFVTALASAQLPPLHEPTYEGRTLRWLYDRSMNRLTPEARRVLAAVGMLAQQPVPLSVAIAVLATPEPPAREALKSLVRYGLLRLSRGAEDLWECTHALVHQFARTAADLTVLSALGTWAGEHFAHAVRSVAVRRVEDTRDFTLLGQALTHASALLRADHDSHALAALQEQLLYDGLEQIERLGWVDFARVASEAVHDWLTRALARQPDNVALQRELSVSHNKVGNVLVAQGQLGPALSAYTASHTITKQLATKDPGNAQWQHDLSVSHIKVGDVLVAQGQLDPALSAYTASHAIRKQFATQDPGNVQWQRSLAVSHIKVEDVLMAQGKLGPALSAYVASRTIREQLAMQDPGSAQWQRDLAVSRGKVGNVLVAQGQLDPALSVYTAGRTIFEQLVTQDPGNAQWQRDLARSYMVIGETFARQNERAKASRYLEQARTISARLAEQDPTNVMWRDDLAWVQKRVAELGTAEK